MYRKSVGPVQVFDLTKETREAGIHEQLVALHQAQAEIIETLQSVRADVAAARVSPWAFTSPAGVQ